MAFWHLPHFGAVHYNGVTVTNSTTGPPDRTLGIRSSEREYAPMADKFDPYREALIMETNTIWSEQFDHLEPAEKQQIEDALHADPESCSNLEYVRVHTGFCRQITVTEEDYDRVAGSVK